MKKKNLIKLQDITFGTIAVSSLFLLLGANGAFATTSVVDDVTVTVPAACTMSTTVNSNHTATVEVGSYVEDIGETTFKVICNDSEGFSVYAVGYTNDTFGNNTMKPSVLADTNAIATGLATSGDTSNWAMKLTAVTGDYAPTLETGFNAYHEVPAEYTKVASYSSNTDSSSGSSFKSTYAAFVASAQPADTYTGKVKYTVIRPANADAPGMEISDLTYMQDFKNLTAAQRVSVLNSMEYNTTYNLIDNRDNKTYQVARLKDGNIWMAENLDLGRTELTQDLTSANTNMPTTISSSTFNSWKKEHATDSYTAGEFIPIDTTSTGGYPGTDIDPVSNNSYGTLYNYCAASAGTICTDNNTSNAQYDICPAGWRLPAGGSNGEYAILYNIADYHSFEGMRNSIVNGGAAFSHSGDFSSYSSYGVSGVSSNGAYWTSKMMDRSAMMNMYLSAPSIGSPQVIPDTPTYSYYGYSVRCLAKKPTHTLTVSYGTGVSSVTINGYIIQNGETINLEDGVSYDISMTPSTGYVFSYWSSTSGSFEDTNSQSTNYLTSNSDVTIIANSSFVTTELQNLPQNNCTSTASNARDSRDNHVYIIQRLEDGNCWMMENLDLGRTDLTTDLTSSNTNLSTTVTASTFNGWKKTIGTSTLNAGEFIPVNGTDSSNGVPFGTLYNYYAASAGTIMGNSSNANAQYDICPAGWRLPTGGSSGEFQNLYNIPTYNSSYNMLWKGKFTRSGYFTIEEAKGANNSGYYWSSTSYTDTNMYYMTISIQSTIPASYSNRNFGASVRCILK